MARVTPTEVKEIINTTLTGTQLNPFITVANILVTEKLANSTILSETMLKEIERWLSAHFISIYKQAGASASGGTLTSEAVSETVGSTSISYRNTMDNISGFGLQSSPYLQQAYMIDITGTLVDLGKRKAFAKTIKAPSLT